MDKNELETRTRLFALRVVKFVRSLPRDRESGVLGRQLLRSGTSVGANYREANRAQSRRDFVHKIALVEKEAAETQYWLSLVEGAGIGRTEERQWLMGEATELVAIFTSIGKSCKAKKSG